MDEDHDDFDDNCECEDCFWWSPNFLSINQFPAFTRVMPIKTDMNAASGTYL